jgi:hypothetical protein
MALNLDDNKRPYFKQLNLDETFDEIQNAFNTLENSVPSPSSDVTVNQLVTIATASVGSLVISNTASIATSAADDSVLTINNTTGKVNKKTGRNTYEALITQSGTASPVITDVITAITASTITISRDSVGSYILTSSNNIFLQNKVLINGNILPTTSDAYAIPVLFTFDDLAGYRVYISIYRYSNTELYIKSFDNASNSKDLSENTCLSDNPLYLKIEILP